jgi:hypothetical protein
METTESKQKEVESEEIADYKGMSTQEAIQMRDIVFKMPLNMNKPVSIRNPTIGYVIQLSRERKMKYNHKRYNKKQVRETVASAAHNAKWESLLKRNTES